MMVVQTRVAAVEGGEKPWNSRYLLEVKPTGFASGWVQPGHIPKTAIVGEAS